MAHWKMAALRRVQEFDFGDYQNLGSKISIISKWEIRYEGILYTIDTKDSTITLSKVRSFDTEDRPTDHHVARRDKVYDYIIFKVTDIKDIRVCQPPPTLKAGLPNDPAIVQHFATAVSTASTSKPSPIGTGPSAKLQKVQEFDLEALKEFKKSLICGHCKMPPRPGGKIYSCCNQGGDKCEIIRCQKCFNFSTCIHGHYPRGDPNLTKFASIFKFYNCVYLKNGCQEELEAKSLEAHERTCLLRDVTCPKLACNRKFAFNGILDHYQSIHSITKAWESVMKFKGSLEDLKKNNSILNCYGRPFYPQFHVKGSVLHVWVVGHGDRTEISSFDYALEFYVNEKKFVLPDTVKAIDTDKNLLTSGQSGLMVPVKNLTQYYDVQSEEFKNQGFIEIQVKVVSEKLDEIAKDENVESGVEDSE